MQGALAVRSPVRIAGDRRARCVFYSPARLLPSKGRWPPKPHGDPVL